MPKRIPPTSVIRTRARRVAHDTAVRAIRGVGLEHAARARFGAGEAARAARRGGTQEAAAWAEVKFEVRTAVAGDGPVVIGPWLSEVGFEVLYWVPFLRWLCDRFEIDRERLHVVSRGGVQSWYADVADGYTDIFDIMSPDQFRVHTEGRWADVGGQKQMALDKWDREILDLANVAQGQGKHAIVHPSLMYRLFRNYWKGSSPLHHVERHTKIKRLAAPAVDEWSRRLPHEPFVAVKFYFRPSFPDIPANRRLVRDVVDGLAAQAPVVVLNTGLNVDDHAEADPGTSDRITWLLDGVPPSLNLHVQSAAISRSRSFVGTYGGLSYLAPCYGIPSLAFYSQEEHFLPAHLDFARRVATRSGGSISVVGSTGLDLLRRLGSPVAAEDDR